MSLRDRVTRLLARLPTEPQYPTQGATLFVDLTERRVARAYTPRAVVETFLEGRGANMFYLWNLLDPTLEPLHPDVPMILGTGLLTGIVSSAARGNVTGWSPETRALMDSNAGDYLPGFMKLQGIDRFVLFGAPATWTWLHVEGGEISFRDATSWVGLDNLDLRAHVERELGGTFGRDLAMANVTSAGERGVLCAGIMAGPKAIFARGGTGAKMGALKLKAIVLRGFDVTRGNGAVPAEVKLGNREVWKQYASTSVVKNALKVRGTPFLYKPSRLLGAMGTKNNQESTWTDALDAEKLDPYRPGMEGCFRCGVNCRPLNDLHGYRGDRYDAGDGPEYVTVGKFGPMIGVSDAKFMVRLNNIANDLGLDTASLGSSIAWAMELWQRGIVGPVETGGLDLSWGNHESIERLFFLTARREGFGDVIACSARAVDEGRYPPQALDYRMAVKGLMQSDPHDARILKAFALGLAVATRGMDHLRNRVTLEINAKINDDPAFKAELYGGPVSAEPNSYVGKETAVRACEDMFAVGDSVGMCRFTTQLFNSPSLPGYPEFAMQIRNVTGLEMPPERLRAAGLNVTGLERMINYALGLRRTDDTLPRRWFEEELQFGKYAGEKIDRAEFDALLTRFYQVSGLDAEGRPALEFRARLTEIASGFAIVVHGTRGLPGLPEEGVVVSEEVRTLSELARHLGRLSPSIARALDEGAINFAVNGEVALHGARATPIRSGDRIELVMAMAGG